MNDTERLDALQRLLDKKMYTGLAILRPSTTSRGFRLHESGQEGSSNDIRKVIDDGLKIHYPDCLKSASQQLYQDLYHPHDI